MYGINHFDMFLMAALLLNITPGTDTMYIISRSISQGRAAGLYSVIGIAVGSIMHTLLAAFGLSMILMKSTLVFNLIKIIGAIYLAYLGVKMLMDKKENQADIKLDMQTFRRIFTQGFITNLTNPKVALFFLAFLPQFIHADSDVFNPVPFIILGLTFTFTGALWGVLTAYFSSMDTHKLRRNSKVGGILNKLTGMVFVGIAIKLFNTKAPL